MSGSLEILPTFFGGIEIADMSESLHSSSIVRAPIRRRYDFNLAKAISMGLRSGL
jgi:hypothetical protein